jgi:hypothetical protein
MAGYAFRAVAPTPLCRRGGREYPPEMRLVLAVFEDAIRAAARPPSIRNGRGQRDYVDARAWVQETDRAWPFAFPNVCDLLGLDADAVRRRVLRGGVQLETDGRRRSQGLPRKNQGTP